MFPFSPPAGLTWFSRLPSLLSVVEPGAAGRLAAGTQAGLALACWCAHFFRRLWEVFFVNDYSGNFQRDSRLELLYYSLWGWLAGAAVGSAPLQLHGPASPLCAAVGVAAFGVGELGNFWCHAELRRLRAGSAGLAGGTKRTGQYVIPSRGPFRSRKHLERIGFGVLLFRLRVVVHRVFGASGVRDSLQYPSH